MMETINFQENKNDRIDSFKNMEYYLFLKIIWRRVAQGLERYLDTVEVGGSSPPAPIKKYERERGFY